jgi:hypothetical protein
MHEIRKSFRWIFATVRKLLMEGGDVARMLNRGRGTKRELLELSFT